MYIYLYKTTNLLNNKEYIGVHSTQTLDDDYMGSGTAITRAIRKHGKNNFRKEIIQFFSSEQEAYEAEERIVNEDYVSSEHTYNLTVGGNRPPPFNKPHTPETRQRLIEYATTEAGKNKNSKAGRRGWEVKGEWTQDEIDRRVATRKKDGSYSVDMSSCHTQDAIKKRCQSRLINKIKKIESFYGQSISLELIQKARSERVVFISEKALSQHLTNEYTHLLSYDEQQSI